MAKKVISLLNTGRTAADISETEMEGIDGYLDYLSLSVKVDLDTGDTMTLAETLAEIDRLIINKDGQPIVDIRGDDMAAMNEALFGLRPYYIVGSAAEDNKVLGIKIPLWLPRSQWSKKMTYQIEWTANVDITGGILSLKANVLKNPRSQKHLEFKGIAFGNGSNSGLNVFDNQKEIPISNGKELVGLGIFATTVPTATADTSTVRKINLSSNGTLQIETDWDTLGADAYSPSFGDSTNWTALREKYRFINLMDDPFPAGKATLDFSSQAADAVRLIPVFKSVV